MEELKKLITEYEKQIEEQQRRAKKNDNFKNECFYRITQLRFVIKDLERIIENKI